MQTKRHLCFDRPLEYKEIDNPHRKFWQPRRFTHEEFYYIDPAGNKHRVPAGECDLATMPWPLSLIWPQDGPYKQSAAAHDYWWSIADNKADVLLYDARFYRCLYFTPETAQWQDELFYSAVRLVARIKSLF